MNPGYHRVFNVHALRDVLRTVDIPDPQLGVGWAESLSTVPANFNYQAPAQAPTFEKVTTLDDVGVKWQGSQVSADQFPATGWMGEAYGGW